MVADWPEVASGVGRPVSVGVPAMSVVEKARLGELPVRTGFRAVELVHRPAGWTGRSEDGAVEGPFAALALAVPPP